MKSPSELETLWLDYVLELAREARADPTRDETTVVIGIHPFVAGTALPPCDVCSPVCRRKIWSGSPTPLPSSRQLAQSEGKKDTQSPAT
jgi:hypothetical protein